MNKAILIGRLTKDPESTESRSGIAITKFTIAVDRPVAEGKEKAADFIQVVTFSKLADTCKQYLKKARLVAVDGRIQTGSYENNEGKKVYTTDIIADAVKFLEAGAKTDNQTPVSVASPSTTSSQPPAGFGSPAEYDPFMN